MNMKTKLLRKVRKRFEINYYPNGYDFGGEIYSDHECMIVIDKAFCIWSATPIRYKRNEWESKEEAYDECYKQLLSLIRNIYYDKGTRRNKKLKKAEEKLWHVIK